MSRRKPTHTLVEAARLRYKGLKGCNECRQVLPLDSFTVNARDPSGRAGMCKPCRRDSRRKAGEEKARLLDMDFNELTTEEWLSLSPEELGISTEVWHGVYLRKVDEKTVRRLVKGGGKRRKATCERFLKQSEEWA